MNMLTGAEALAMARTAWIYTGAGLAAIVLVAVGGIVYFSRRWSWYPRRVQRTRFNERI